MQVLNVTLLPIYLPYDVAPVPFGDPFSDATITLASPGVVSVPGYVPVNGQAIVFSIPVGGGTLPAAIVAGTTYFIVGAVPATGAFNVSATKGGAAINTATASTGIVTAHLVSAEVDGVVLPFKTGNTVVVMNLTGGSLTLQGAPDLNTTQYGNPQGPGAFVTLAVVPATSAALAQLSQDWIRVSTAATLVLLQN
jgi:hypothetical protein